MYVCLCNGLTDRQVRAAACARDCTAAGVYRSLGCQPRCGKCVPMVRSILADAAGMRPMVEETRLIA